MKRNTITHAVALRAKRLRRRAALPNALPNKGETWIA